jgi:hypothetical protein
LTVTDFKRAGGCYMSPRQKTFLTSDPDILMKREGGGCLSLFGLPFLLAGLFIMQIPIGFIPVSTEKAPLPWYFFVLFGGVFAVVGASLVFGRRGLVIDRRQQVVRVWWGLLLPMKSNEYPLERFARVKLSRDAGDSDSGDTYPVHLVGEWVDKPLLIEAPTDYQEARTTGEFLARFLQRPLEDISSGKKVVRDPDNLDESLKERVLRTQEDVRSLPPPPLEMRTNIEQTSEGVELEIPGPPLKGFRLIPLVLVLAMVGMVGKFFLPMFFSLPGPKIIRYGFAAFIGLFFIFLPIASVIRHLLRIKRQTTRVTVNPALLRVEEHRSGKILVTEILAEDLRELTLPTVLSALEEVDLPGTKRTVSLGHTGVARMPDGRPAPRILEAFLRCVGLPGITATGKKARVTFGKGLSEAELLYLHALVRYIIAGG